MTTRKLVLVDGESVHEYLRNVRNLILEGNTEEVAFKVAWRRTLPGDFFHIDGEFDRDQFLRENCTAQAFRICERLMSFAIPDREMLTIYRNLN
jgi:hypothetical protein